MKDLRALLAVLAAVALAAPACRTTREVIVPAAEPPSIGPEMELANTAAYPEGSYTVRWGDTTKSIAAKFDLDHKVLLNANGFTDTTVLKPGEAIVIPRVALRPPADRTMPRSERSIPATETRETAKADASGRVIAVSAGNVTAVHRAYPGLGDVVIIENNMEKVIYSGSFEPLVAKGAPVSSGDAIGRANRGGKVEVSRFPK